VNNPGSGSGTSGHLSTLSVRLDNLEQLMILLHHLCMYQLAINLETQNMGFSATNPLRYEFKMQQVQIDMKLAQETVACQRISSKTGTWNPFTPQSLTLSQHTVSTQSFRARA
jgi:hypothetical protein